MTKMALGWVEHLERVRADKAQETEAHRANQQREWETHRANTAQEMLTSRNIDEIERSNRVKERETYRHDLAVEQENKRANLANEAIRQEQNSIAWVNADSQQKMASQAILQANVAYKNAETRAKELVVRQNELIEKQKQREANYEIAKLEMKNRLQVSTVNGLWGLVGSAAKSAGTLAMAAG